MPMTTGDVKSFVGGAVKVITVDGRRLIGVLLAFDKYMNIIISECEEFRKFKSNNNEERRYLGLVVLRGEHIISTSRITRTLPQRPVTTDMSKRVKVLHTMIESNVSHDLQLPAEGHGIPKISLPKLRNK